MKNEFTGRKSRQLILILLLSLLLTGCGGAAKEYNEQGLALYEAGDFAGAKEAFGKAVEENKRSAGYYANYAMTCTELGEMDAAADAYEKALSLSSKDPYVYRGLGIYYTKAGLYQQAIAAFANAEQYGSRDKDFLLDVREYKAEAQLTSGDYMGAVSTYQKVLEDDPRNVTVQYLMGRALLLAGDTDGAVGAFGRLETLNAADSAYYTEIWNSLTELGLQEQAENLMQRILSRQGTDAASVRLRGLAAFLLGDYERVVQELQNLPSQDRETMEYLAVSYAQTGRSVEALAMYDRLQAEDPESGEIAARLAEYYLSSGQIDQALSLIRSAKEKLSGEERREVDYYEAVCLEYQGDFAGALSAFQAWKSAYGEDDRVNHEIEFLKTR